MARPVGTACTIDPNAGRVLGTDHFSDLIHGRPGGPGGGLAERRLSRPAGEREP